MSDEITVWLNIVAGLPLHGVLFLVVAVLWRRMNVIQEKLDDCLGSYGEKDEKTR